ncbi:MAG: glycolate oxidase subunit GlcF [Candidatus Thiodiazotropha sp. (ex Monitilora ramsayi)]|nr:glycolate oxidase subunit GlcF [Candidatus Thiodiazotropha sp. (ex Monitilora ramsayi)]
METSIVKTYLETPEGQEAEKILRACVHCGFCTATCPTYQILGDELDGPRGRIYLIKQVLEGKTPTHRTQQHLDRCLTCRSCETTCPSGVQYSRLADIGREIVEGKVRRPLTERLKRFGLRKLLPYPRRFAFLLTLGRAARPFMPDHLRRKLPSIQSRTTRLEAVHKRRMLVLEGCAQQAATPNTNAATARLLHRLGISLISEPQSGCCGAVSHHLSAQNESRQAMRRNIDAWWPHIEAGAEAIVITASGCGAMVKEYGHLMRHDPAYADKAATVSSLTRDIAEILTQEDLTSLSIQGGGKPIAFHSPCTLQHGQKLPGIVESILQRLDYKLTPVADNHLCCGSAGTYSLLQSELSQQLLTQKLSSLTEGQPDLIATANIGCQLHLASQSEIPVQHWIELLDEAMQKDYRE